MKNNNCNKFTRGQDPKTTMNIGKKAEIIKWLTELGVDPRYYEIDDKLNVTVTGNLYLNYTKITEIPDNLTVGGNLELSYTNISQLPDNLTVGENLILWGIKITKLPDNLTIGGDLDLNHTSITELPKDLVVKGKIYGFEK